MAAGPAVAGRRVRRARTAAPRSWRAGAASPRRRRASSPARSRPTRRCRRRGSTPTAAPLETLVERAGAPLPSTRRTSAEGLRLAVDTGRHFLRLLGPADDVARLRTPTSSRAFAVPEPTPDERWRRSTRRPPATRGCTPAAASTGGGCGPSSRGRDLPAARPSRSHQADRAELPGGRCRLAAAGRAAVRRRRSGRDELAARPVRVHRLVRRPDARRDPFERDAR